jgi:chorismate synthase
LRDRQDIRLKESDREDFQPRTKLKANEEKDAGGEKIDVSCETLIGAGFPRYDEIVKRFMKAFMKGFTSHGPNWGPGFASATHVLLRL